MHPPTIRNRWKPRGTALIKAAFLDEHLTLRINNYDPAVIEPQLWVNTLWALWTGAAADASADVRLTLKPPRKNLDTLRFHLDEAIWHVARHADSIIETTIEAVTNETAAAIDDLYNQWDTWRTDTIVDTELGQAVAWASDRTAKLFNAEFKKWRTQNDTFVRPTHQQAEHHPPIAINESFTVGGAQLEYPLDPSGPIEEIVNCRCWVEYLAL